MSTISSFKSIENKHDVHRDKDYMKKFCKSLREHAMKIINSKKKKMNHMNHMKSYESFEYAKICYICHEKLKINM